jgi:hypothetical protein
MIMQHDNKTHERTCNLAESARQTGVSAAISQAAVKAVEATYLRAVINSCVANGIESAVFRQGLFELSGSRT